ncbi:MAG: DNA-binding protein [Rhodospirillales bacterium]|nr:MAG: DNA-binding protein [Rhodospirillales bacterium]
MTFSSSLTDDPRPLVLDTSVLINLHACTFGERILMAIPNAIVVPNIVADELDTETGRRNGDHGFLHGLVAQGKISIVAMTDEEYDLFAALTSGTPSLDDGEAATIAVAARREFRAVIDERKGRTQAVARMGGEEPGWTLDLLQHPAARRTLGDADLAEAIYLALREGRMRIPQERGDTLVTLIGIERALHCSCLPNYKGLSKRGNYCPQ